MCDVGAGDQTSTAATKCLVFMTNAVNDRFKMTLAHFFVDNLNGKGKIANVQRANCNIGLMDKVYSSIYTLL